MKYILLKLIQLYQKIPGPWHNNCRFIPSCSAYAYTAIDRFGSLKGSYLAIKRILKCNPLGGSGYDAVPNKGEKK